MLQDLDRQPARSTVLVVDEAPELAASLQDLVERDGHCCLTACDLEEANWILEMADVDVIVVDVDASGRHPLRWFERLRRRRPRLASRAVFVSGPRLRPEDELRILAYGATIVGKPFLIRELHDAIMHDAPISQAH